MLTTHQTSIVASLLTYLRPVAACIGLVLPLSPSYAEILGFVENPQSNSVDWQQEVTSLGATEIKTLDLETHPLGELQANFYVASDGVALAQQGLGQVKFGHGPGEKNDFTIGGTKIGEGVHEESNYIFDPQGFSTLTISFDAPVLGAGLFVIDYFNPGNGSNRLKIEAYSSPDAKGQQIGTFLSARKVNLQKNKLYFMGITDPDQTIRSIVFTDIDGKLGDRTGIDNIMFARGEETMETQANNRVEE